MHEIDLLVIGGGINGAGIARDASGRGLRVLLCEQHDLAAHTSSASSKLIHGGLRYLEQGQFGLVRKALGEREVVRRQAPHLVHPLRFVLPWEPHLRPRWMLRVGLWLYDHLGRRGPSPRHARWTCNATRLATGSPRRCGRPSATPMRRSMTRDWYCSSPWMPRSEAHRCGCAVAASTCAPCRADGRLFWSPPMASRTM